MIACRELKFLPNSGNGNVLGPFKWGLESRVVDFPERIANLTKIVSEKGPWAEKEKLND